MKNLKFIKKLRKPAAKRAVSVFGVVAILALLVFVAIGSVQAAGADEAEKSLGPIGFIFNFLNKQPIVFLLLALGFGYPLGRVAVKGISLGPTAGTLLVGVAISLLQALTQIQEMTLVFVPKILAIFVAMLVALPFMGDLMQGQMARLAARITGG